MMMKLLLIDDDQFLRDMYAMKFTESGYKVFTADRASVAFREMQQQGDFDVVLLDMIMPTMSGIEIIKAIKEQFPDSKAKCIVLSNQGQESDINAAKAAGAIGYIIKAEVVPSEVVERVEKLIKE